MVQTPQFSVQKYSDIAGDLIREEILGGELGPGQRINEIALSERLKISRSPLREALRVLQAEGLVRMVPGRGAFVSSPDVDSVRHMGEARLAIETHVARLAAERIDDEGRASLQRVMDALENVLADPTRSYPVQIDFHHALTQIIQNPKLSQLSDEIERQLRLARNARASVPGRAQEVLHEHRRIFNAVIAGDADASAEHMRMHIEQSTNAMLGILSSEA